MHYTYYTGSGYYSRAHYGHGRGPIHLDNVNCRGSEQRLIDCSYSGLDCTHAEDASVYCRPSMSYIILWYTVFSLEGGGETWDILPPPPPLPPPQDQISP